MILSYNFYIYSLNLGLFNYFLNLPAAKRASGPTNTRPMLWSLQNWVTIVWLLTNTAEKEKYLNFKAKIKGRRWECLFSIPIKVSLKSWNSPWRAEWNINVRMAESRKELGTAPVCTTLSNTHLPTD